MSAVLRPRGGRPRLPGARERSGRPSRRISVQEEQFRTAQASWRSFVLEANISENRSFWNQGEWHPILNLVRLGKTDGDSFIISLYWICTEVAIAPHWKGREYLTKVTGFDFTTSQGCLAAHRFAKERLSRDCVYSIDQAAFRGEFHTDAKTLSENLHALWEIWCSHLQTKDASQDRAGR